MDVNRISVSEMKEDRAASLMEIACCQRLLAVMPDGDPHRAVLAERLDGSKKIVVAIEAEMRRRQEVCERCHLYSEDRPCGFVSCEMTAQDRAAEIKAVETGRLLRLPERCAPSRPVTVEDLAFYGHDPLEDWRVM